MKIEVYADGGVRNHQFVNKREAYGSYFICCGNGNEYSKRARYGSRTNNESEYLALIGALTRVQELMRPGDTVTAYTDSTVVERQTSGKWQVKTEHLRSLCDDATALLEITGATLVRVPRAVIVGKLGH